ncbi:MAG: hypothetical protein J6Z11_01350 [Candidatus Riflebacteria bacterium]|nr:hypothetical protein [Candidatus Riflebacteria bacterium]
MEKKKKSFKSIITITIIILIVTNIITSAGDYLESLSKRSYSSDNWHWYGYVYCPKFNETRYKVCAMNIRELESSVDEYNMDNSEMMHYLDQEKLLESNYLKAIPTTNDPRCKYISKGDLTTEDGEICCKKHGSFSDIIQKIEIEKKEYERMNTFYFYCIRIFPALLYFLFMLIYVLLNKIIKKQATIT